eukprot:scaffold2911_cov414-Prasinococcus_capsulatus_cf.AAC.43
MLRHSRRGPWRYPRVLVLCCGQPYAPPRECACWTHMDPKALLFCGAGFWLLLLFGAPSCADSVGVAVKSLGESARYDQPTSREAVTVTSATPHHSGTQKAQLFRQKTPPFEDVPQPQTTLELTSAEYNALSVMVQRREHFASCIVNASALASHPPIISVDLLKGCDRSKKFVQEGHRRANSRPAPCTYEIVLCPEYGLAYYHIFKAGGPLQRPVLHAARTFVKSLLGKLCGKDGIVIFADGPLGHHLDPKGSWHPTLKAYQGFTIVRDTLPRFVSAYHEELLRYFNLHYRAQSEPSNRRRYYNNQREFWTEIWRAFHSVGDQKGPSPSAGVIFAKFLSAVADMGWNQWQGHHRPQSSFLVGQGETMPGLKYILDLDKLREELPLFIASATRNRLSQNMVESLLSSKALASRSFDDPNEFEVLNDTFSQFRPEAIKQMYEYAVGLEALTSNQRQQIRALYEDDDTCLTLH